jgi:hypothetical protein
MDDVDQQPEPGDGEYAFAPMRTSVEKLASLADLLPGLEPDDEKSARMLQMLMNIWPHVAVLLPQDHERLDELLLGLARYALMTRSDGAGVPATIAELLEVPEVPA